MIKFSTFEPSNETVQALWANIQNVAEWAMDDSSTLEVLVKGLLAPDARYFNVHDGNRIVGYCSLTDITPRDAYFHALFWDRKVIGRGARVNQLVARLIQQYRLALVRITIPVTHEAGILMLRRMGWHEGGSMRHFIYRHGQPIDGILFSVTQEELTNEQHVQNQEAKDQKQNQNGPAQRGDTGAFVPHANDGHVSGGRETADIGRISWHAESSGIWPAWIATTDHYEEHAGCVSWAPSEFWRPAVRH